MCVPGGGDLPPELRTLLGGDGRGNDGAGHAAAPPKGGLVTQRKREIVSERVGEKEGRYRYMRDMGKVPRSSCRGKGHHEGTTKI